MMKSYARTCMHAHGIHTHAQTLKQRISLDFPMNVIESNWIKWMKRTKMRAEKEWHWCALRENNNNNITQQWQNANMRTADRCACALSPNISNIYHAECMCKHQNVFTSCSKWMRHNMMMLPPLRYVSISFPLYLYVCVSVSFQRFHSLRHFFGSVWDLDRAHSPLFLGACTGERTLSLSKKHIYICTHSLSRYFIKIGF